VAGQRRSGSPGTLPHLQREFGRLRNGAVGRPVHFPTYKREFGRLRNGTVGRPVHFPTYKREFGRLRNGTVGRPLHFSSLHLELGASAQSRSRSRGTLPHLQFADEIALLWLLDQLRRKADLRSCLYQSGLVRLCIVKGNHDFLLGVAHVDS